MPIVNVQMFPGRTIEQKRKVAKAITDAMVEHLKIDASAVTVLFQEVPRESWASGGTLFSDRQ